MEKFTIKLGGISSGFALQTILIDQEKNESNFRYIRFKKNDVEYWTDESLEELVNKICDHEPCDTGIPGGTVWCKHCSKDIYYAEGVEAWLVK